MSQEGPRLLLECDALVERMYTESGAKRLGVRVGVFAAALETSAQKRFAAGGASAAQVETYLGSLHAEDLALACACCEGSEVAWEEFVTKYRSYLRSASAAILRCSSGAAEAIEFADSLFAELYGLADGKRGERSLFRYFHGRSSLKTWLRAVLAQRRINAVRAGKKFEPLEGADGEVNHAETLASNTPISVDPDREEYLRVFEDALRTALGELDQRDAGRLRLYYADGETLAEIGQRMGEHESSVSRNLERVRKDLRKRVEEMLRCGRGAANGQVVQKDLSDAQIALCFEYATGETAMDLEKLLGRKAPGGASTDKLET